MDRRGLTLFRSIRDFKSLIRMKAEVADLDEADSGLKRFSKLNALLRNHLYHQYGTFLWARLSIAMIDHGCDICPGNQKCHHGTPGKKLGGG